MFNDKTYAILHVHIWSQCIETTLFDKLIVKGVNKLHFSNETGFKKILNIRMAHNSLYELSNQINYLTCVLTPPPPRNEFF